jgi:hypothetical protein
MESIDLSISAEFQDPSATAVTDALAALAPGASPIIRGISMSVPTIGGSVELTLGNAMIEPDVTFNPGNDWNGITIKCTAVLAAGAKKLDIS